MNGDEVLAINTRAANKNKKKKILAKMAAYECLEVEKVQRKSN